MTARRAPAHRPRARGPLLLAATLLLIALNLRLAITSVSPVLDDVRAALGLSNAGAGLLTTAPVLCFGLAAPLAPLLARRLGSEVVLLGCLLALAGGIALRIVPEIAPLFAGTVLLGVAIAVANVLLPSVIKRDFERPGTMMGLYTMALGGSGGLAAGLTVPLEHGLGEWRWAMAAWGVPALLAALLWLPAVRLARQTPVEQVARVSVWRDRTAWLITGLLGFQSLLFYCMASWVPDILRDAGMSSGTAGLMLSVAMIVGLPASMVVPVFAVRMRDQRPLAFAAVVLWASGLLGLLLSPATATVAWMVLVGLGQGAGISLALTLVVLRTADEPRAAAMSGMAQTVGYVMAAVGPVTLGIVHDATGGWDAPILLMLGATLAMLACGLGAARPGMVDARTTSRGGAPVSEVSVPERA